MAEISAATGYESATVIILATVIAMYVTRVLSSKAKKETEKRRENAPPGDTIAITGEGLGLKWYFTTKGQVAVFVGVFLTIVFAYIGLKFAP